MRELYRPPYKSRRRGHPIHLLRLKGLIRSWQTAGCQTTADDFASFFLGE
eukprot:gene4287-3103_t